MTEKPKVSIPESMRPEGLDQEYEALRVEWHKRREAWMDDGGADSGQAWRAFGFIDEKLRNYLWDKTKAAIAEDRRKHPKARRNMPVPKRDEGEPSPGARMLP